MKVRLEVSHNKANVKRIVLERDAIIGRGADCNLRIAANSISRHHCKISITPREVYVRDLGSSNGTYVEGKRIEPNEDVLVASGAKLTLGGVKFRVLYDAPVTEAETEDDSELGSTIEFPAVGSAANPVEADASPADSKVKSDPEPISEDAAPAEPVAEEAKVNPKVAAKKAAANAAAAAAAAAATAAAAAAEAAQLAAAEAAQAEETTDEEAVAEAGADLFPTDEVADASEETIVVDPGAMQQHVDDELVAPEEEADESLADTISAAPDQLAETTDFVMGNLEAQSQADAATAEDEDVEYEEEEVEEEAPKKKGLLGSVMGMFGRKKAVVEEVEEEVEEEDVEYEEEEGEAAAEGEDVEYEYEEEDVDEAENAAADFLADVGGEAAAEATEEDEGLGDFLSDLGGK